MKKVFLCFQVLRRGAFNEFWPVHRPQWRSQQWVALLVQVPLPKWLLTRETRSHRPNIAGNAPLNRVLRSTAPQTPSSARHRLAAESWSKVVFKRRPRRPSQG